jgi:hypothetical protein
MYPAGPSSATYSPGKLGPQLVTFCAQKSILPSWRTVLLELLGLDSIVGAHDGFGRPSYAELAMNSLTSAYRPSPAKTWQFRPVSKTWKKPLYPGGDWQVNLPKNPKADAKLGLLK